MQEIMCGRDSERGREREREGRERVGGLRERVCVGEIVTIGDRDKEEEPELVRRSSATAERKKNLIQRGEAAQPR